MAESLPKALPMRLMLAMRWSNSISSTRSIRCSIAKVVHSVPCRPRRRLFRDSNSFGRAGLRLLFAGAGGDQRPIGGAHCHVDEWIVQRTGIRERHIAAEG